MHCYACLFGLLKFKVSKIRENKFWISERSTFLSSISKHSFEKSCIAFNANIKLWVTIYPFHIFSSAWRIALASKTCEAVTLFNQRICPRITSLQMKDGSRAETNKFDWHRDFWEINRFDSSFRLTLLRCSTFCMYFPINDVLCLQQTLSKIQSVPPFFGISGVI